MSFVREWLSECANVDRRWWWFLALGLDPGSLYTWPDLFSRSIEKLSTSEFEIPAKATMQKNNSSSRCISSLLFLSWLTRDISSSWEQQVNDLSGRDSRIDGKSGALKLIGRHLPGKVYCHCLMAARSWQLDSRFTREGGLSLVDDWAERGRQILRSSRIQSSK